LRVKWYGTASVLLEKNGVQLLFDPFIPLNNKIYKPPVEELASAGNFFVTHGHFDHILGIPPIFKHGSGKAAVFCMKNIPAFR